MKTPDYLELTYSEQRLPPSQYPILLTRWLMTHFFQKPGRLLDVGCGRAEYLRAFSAEAFEAVGIDSASSAGALAAELQVEIVNVEREAFPLPAESFDYVFSKSVIEHLHHPDHMLAECFRVLRPGGVVVIMTPSWRHQWRVFYEDYTHVSPFTANGLADALTLAGFNSVQAQLFWQLPFLWKRPWLFGFVKLISGLPLKYRPWDLAPWPEELNKLIRFSKEVMLLGVGRKA